jgi:Domain of unknown function (DUF4157)
VYPRIHKTSSWNPPSQKKSSQVAAHLFAVQAQQDSHEPPTPQEIENEAFNQNKLEAFGLQLKEQHGTITPVEQGKLGVLQAKMDDFWAQRLEGASRFAHNFANIPVHAPGQKLSAPIQHRLAIQPNRVDTPLQSLQPAIAPTLTGDRATQAKSDTTSDRPGSSVEQRPNETGMPDALKAGVESLSGYSLEDVRVHYNSPKPAQLQALAYAQGTEIHVASGQEKHLPHEAWHVVQQMQGRVQPTMQMKNGVPINDDAGLEYEADVMGAKALDRQASAMRGIASPREPVIGGFFPPARALAGSIQKQIQRVRDPLTTKQILGALKNVSFIKEKLNIQLHGTKMGDRIAEMLRSWKEHCAKKNNEDLDIRDAMMLSMALEGVARVISEEINDPSVQPAVAQKLFELYRDAVGTKLKKEKGNFKGTARTKVLNLTEAFIADDPVTRFMHREIGLEAAARQINTMAIAAQATDITMTATRMFELMKQKFEVKMASYHQAQLHADNTSDRFSIRESPGEYSTYYFEQMFGPNPLGAGDQLQWVPQGAGSADDLAFSPSAQGKLFLLEQAVAHPPVPAPVVPRAGLTAGQEQHLASIESDEAARNLAGVQAQFEQLFQTRYHITAAAAATMYTNVVQHLQNAPITITVRAADWFGKAAAPDPNFQPANATVAQTPVSQIFRKHNAVGNIVHLPTWNDTGLDATAQRGDKYMRFRAWKDELMSGLRELPARERAVFGALNVTFDTSRGGDSSQQHGANYYGDLHFVLDRNTVGPRTVYTATDHGSQHRDPIFALYDFAFGGRGVTWLKDTEKLGVIDNIVNAVTAQQPIYGLPLLFESQIFGGVNVLTDTTAVHMASNVTAPVQAAVRQFYNGTAVNVVVEGAAPPGAIDAGGDIDPIAMKALVAKASLTALELGQIDTAAQAVVAASPQNRALMANVMTVADYVTKIATAGVATLSASEAANLRAALNRIRPAGEHLCTTNQFTDPDKAAIRNRITAAEVAVSHLP